MNKIHELVIPNLSVLFKTIQQICLYVLQDFFFFLFHILLQGK